MKYLVATAALVLGLALASPASATCYADYRAKKDNPLRLSYGVAELPDSACNKDAAQAVLAPRLANGGWTLLSVESIFGPEGLDEKRAVTSAAGHFLRY